MTTPTHPPEPVPSATPTNEAQPPAPQPAPQPRNPLHGITLEAMVRDHGIGLTMIGGPNSFGAGGYLESLYLFMLREQKRSAAHGR